MHSDLTLKELLEAEILQTVVFPLIVPSAKEVLNSRDLDLSKSALNACYSKPAINKKGMPQSWLDVQLTTEGQENLPPKKEWFYIATEDGYLFKGRFSGKKVQKLSSFENEQIIGAWIKGTLIEWELVDDFDYVCEDRDRIGIITKEVLKIYGGDKILLQKTNKTAKDKKGIERDVWLMSFPFRLD